MTNTPLSTVTLKKSEGVQYIVYVYVYDGDYHPTGGEDVNSALTR